MADLSRSERDAALVQATLDGALRLARLALEVAPDPQGPEAADGAQGPWAEALFPELAEADDPRADSRGGDDARRV